MSFEIFVQAFNEGQPGGVPRQQVCAAFGRYLTCDEPELLVVRYDDENYCEISLNPHLTEDGLIQGFSVCRPCVDARLWDSLASILTLGNLVLYFPGCGAPLVARNSARSHLPAEMVEALGEPVCIISGGEIQRHIQAA